MKPQSGYGDSCTCSPTCLCLMCLCRAHQCLPATGATSCVWGVPVCTFITPWYPGPYFSRTGSPSQKKYNCLMDWDRDMLNFSNLCCTMCFLSEGREVRWVTQRLRKEWKSPSLIGLVSKQKCFRIKILLSSSSQYQGQSSMAYCLIPIYDMPSFVQMIIYINFKTAALPWDPRLSCFISVFRGKRAVDPAT